MWRFLEATTTERQRFATAADALGHPHQLVGHNRLREVRQLVTQDGTYYLKVFWRTQAKNRLRFALTQPRCRTDAERECGVAVALRARGFEAARPVGVGRQGSASWFLCAALPGTSLREHLIHHGQSPALMRGAAQFAAAIARAGIVLPDLSLDHIFVLDARAQRFGVIDLHNGQLGTPSLAAAHRMLRNIRRSALGLGLRQRAALRWATQLLRGMGLENDTRRTLRRLPPWETHTRYDAAGKAKSYGDRNPARHAREVALLRAVWPGRPGDRVLDSPCGTARVTRVLREELGIVPIGVDRSLAMLREAQCSGPARLVLADAQALPLADCATDGVVVFRFLHHLEPQLARQAVREAARVAARFVVVTFFHPCSAHAVRRRIAGGLRRRPPTRHTLTVGRLTRWFDDAGFRRVSCRGELPWIRELWIAAFVRNG